MSQKITESRATLVAECLRMKKGEVRMVHWPGFTNPKDIIPIIDSEVNPLRKRCGMEPIYGISRVQNESEKFNVWCGFF